MKIKIGEYEIIHTQTLIIPGKKNSVLEFKADNWDVSLNIVLEGDEGDPNKSNWKFEGKDDHAVLTLSNWNHSLGFALNEPVEFGVTDNRIIYMMIVGNSIGGTLKLDLQFSMEVAQ